MSDLPRYLQIEPSRTCNLSCVHCIHTGERGFLTYDTFINIIDSNPHCKYIKFQGLGEPLLNSDLYRFCTVAKDRKITVEVLTNGTIPIASHLMDVVDLFGVSIETLDREKYVASRGNNYDQLMRTLDNLAVVFDGDVFINCTKTAWNTPEDVLEVKQTAKLNGFYFSSPLQEVWTHDDNESKQSAAVASERHNESHTRRSPDCVWCKEKLYYDYAGFIHPCCIRMEDRYRLGKYLSNAHAFAATHDSSDICKDCPL